MFTVGEPSFDVDDIPYRWVRDELKFTQSLKRGDQNKRVRFVQECLSLQGIGLRIDGIFGAGTAAGVIAFQKLHGLNATGVVDEQTHHAMIAPFLRALSPCDGAGRMSFGELIVACARQHLAEHPREIGGQNQGPWVRIYMQGMESLWCAAFVFFIVNQAANQLERTFSIETTFSCDQLAARGKAAELFLSERELMDDPSLRRNIRPGTIFLSRRSEDDWTHAGLVTNVPSEEAEYFETIEGNTNDDGYRDGYEVCSRIRGFAKKDFVLIG